MGRRCKPPPSLPANLIHQHAAETDIADHPGRQGEISYRGSQFRGPPRTPAQDMASTIIRKVHTPLPCIAVHVEKSILNRCEGANGSGVNEAVGLAGGVALGLPCPSVLPAQTPLSRGCVSPRCRNEWMCLQHLHTPARGCWSMRSRARSGRPRPEPTTWKLPAKPKPSMQPTRNEKTKSPCKQIRTGRRDSAKCMARRRWSLVGYRSDGWWGVILPPGVHSWSGSIERRARGRRFVPGLAAEECQGVSCVSIARVRPPVSKLMSQQGNRA